MIKERVLEIGINEAIKLFEHHKWKFYHQDLESGILKIEVPRGENEVWVVELPFANQVQLSELTDELSKGDFIKQTIRTVGSF